LSTAINLSRSTPRGPEMAVYEPTYRDAKTKELKQAAVWEKIEP
jgi:hypothetical protein